MQFASSSGNGSPELQRPVTLRNLTRSRVTRRALDRGGKRDYLATGLYEAMLKATRADIRDVISEPPFKGRVAAFLDSSAELKKEVDTASGGWQMMRGAYVGVDRRRRVDFVTLLHTRSRRLGEDDEQDTARLYAKLLNPMVNGICPAFLFYLGTRPIRGGELTSDIFLIDSSILGGGSLLFQNVIETSASQLEGGINLNDANEASVFLQLVYALYCLKQVGIKLNLDDNFAWLLLRMNGAMRLEFFVPQSLPAASNRIVLEASELVKLHEMGNAVAIGTAEERAAESSDDLQALLRVLQLGDAATIYTFQEIFDMFSGEDALLQSDPFRSEAVGAQPIDSQYAPPAWRPLVPRTVVAAAKSGDALRVHHELTTGGGNSNPKGLFSFGAADRGLTLSDLQLTELDSIVEAVNEMMADGSISLCTMRSLFTRKAFKAETASNTVQALIELEIAQRGRVPCFAKVFMRSTTSNGNSLLVESLAYELVTNPLLLQRATPCLVGYYGTLFCNKPAAQFENDDLGQALRLLQVQRRQPAPSAGEEGAFAILLQDMVERGSISLDRVCRDTAKASLRLKTVDAFVSQLEAVKASLVALYFTLECFRRVGFAQNDLHVGNVFMEPQLDASEQRAAFEYAPRKYLLLRLPFMPKIFDFDNAAKRATALNGVEWRNDRTSSESPLCQYGGSCDDADVKADLVRVTLLTWQGLHPQGYTPLGAEAAVRSWPRHTHIFMQEFANFLKELWDDPEGRLLKVAMFNEQLPPERRRDGPQMAHPGILCMCRANECFEKPCEKVSWQEVTGRAELDMVRVMDTAKSLAAYRVERVPPGVPIYTLPGIYSE